MTKSKKLSIFIFSVMLVFASFLFVSCGKNDYSKTNLVATTNNATTNNIELFKGEENSQQISVTIDNPVGNMSTKLYVTNSNTFACKIEEEVVVDYTTTYTITGLNGGDSTLTFITQEGGVSLDIKVMVREYSDVFSKGSNSLYVSILKDVVPSSADFSFKESSTERDLEYYFYGKIKEENSLKKDEILEDETLLSNKFISASLENIGGKDYLIFVNEKDELFTLGSSTVDLVTKNVKYNFVSASFDGKDYSVDSNATSVSAGDKYSFIAKYQGEKEQDIFVCERDFYILIDINKENFSHEYGYKIEGVEFVAERESTSYKLDTVKHGSIRLIPDYKLDIGSQKAIFSTAYLVVTANSTNDLLKVDVGTEDTSVAVSKKIKEVVNGTTKTYYIEINCATVNNAKTNYIVTFYYEGFENSKDENVNYKYIVPIEVQVIPTNLLINNVGKENTSVSYTFYNYYASSVVGWQPFNFAVIPEGAKFEQLSIDLTGADLQIRYKNELYSNEVVHVDNIREPIYIRGIDGAKITAEDKELPITLDFNVIQADKIYSSIKYKIVKGAKVLDFKNDEFEKCVYLDIGKKEYITFDDIYADAEFSTITFAHVPGTDNVAHFEVDKTSPFKLVGSDYVLNFRILPISCGAGSYTISLDNGKMTTINVVVLESLKDVRVSSANENNTISLLQEEVDKDLVPISTLIYAHNKGESPYFDLEVIANSSRDSEAIKSVILVNNGQLITLANTLIDGRKFNVNIKQNGTSNIIVNVDGYTVENFRRLNKSINYNVKIITYDLIQRLNVYKEKDAFAEYENALASYVNVYSNTSNQSAREAKLSVDVKNKNAFLFESPIGIFDTMMVESGFDKNFVYWDSDKSTTIYKDGNVVDNGRMVYDEGASNHIYTVGKYGTFNTETMTFTAFSNLSDSNSVKIVAHVRQYRNIFSYTVNVNISIYEEVERLTLQNMVSELEFSTFDREFTLIAHPTNPTATNPKIVALFKGGSISVGSSNYSILNESSIECLTGEDGKTQIKLSLNPEFLEKSKDYLGIMRGELLIVAEDWLDIAGNLKSEYQDDAVRIVINFANGTKLARFTINDAEGLLAIKDNLSAHYQIKTTIDASNIVDKLPLGELTGSIVGVNEYSCITGLNISNPIVDDANKTNYYGLFKSISAGAFVEYIQFEGSFNIGKQDAEISNFSNIGLVAGENYGQLINIGVKISVSNIYISQGNFGGLVGINYGNIKQDFSLFEDRHAEGKKLYTPLRTFIGNEVSEIANYSEEGRYFYDNLTPKILAFYNDYVYISYKVNTTNPSLTKIGGLVGENRGTIQKVDSKNLTLSGYLNYMSYSLIKTNISNVDSLPNFAIANNAIVGNVGGLVGESLTDAKVLAGYNKVKTDMTDDPFTSYESYNTINATTNEIVGDFKAGNGIVVGGDIWGYGYVGGIVGRISSINSKDNLCGISARTYVRGQLVKKGYNPSNVAIIANIIEPINISGGKSFSTAFAIQAVDDGKLGEEASMAVVYFGTPILSYNDKDGNKLDINKIGFGVSSHGVGALSTEPSEATPENPIVKAVNVFSYVISRSQKELEKDGMKDVENGDIYLPVQFNKNVYYGDFVVVGTNGGNKRVLSQIYFQKGKDENLSINSKFNNQLIGVDENSNKQIFFTYYYQVASAYTKDIASIQEDLDNYLNKITIANEFYPFVARGEMEFASRNTDILTIDQMGKITVKKTGIVQITATSLLNSNDALNIYVYVVNYFDSEYLIEDSSKSSIIYPNLASTATPIDDTIIELRGENSANLYVKPNYFLPSRDIFTEIGNLKFNSDNLGNANIGGVAFRLAENNQVSAQVEEIDELDIDVVGQTITIRKNAKTEEKGYKLKITPRLQLSFNNDKSSEIYYLNVNKVIENTVVDYRFGALSIQNKNFNEVPLSTNKPILETITIYSTDEEEGLPKYQLIGLDGVAVQGTTNGLTEDDKLFNVTISKIGSPEDIGLGRYVHTYTVKIEVNTNSSKFINRYKENIYGRYSLYIEAETNAGKNVLIQIDFEKTNVFSIIADNYTILNEATADGLNATSKYAFPGESGLLAITIMPEDSDFDYILIENDDQNYQAGHSSALLGILARKENATGGQIFEEFKIAGSITSKGLKISLDELTKFYGSEDFVPYNGVIYVKYNMSSRNVVDRSISKINVTLIKDGVALENGTYTKELTIKLQNYVAVEIDGKDGIENDRNYYRIYNVARGLRYKLNINSYGFNLDNVMISSNNTSLGSIIEENGEYYLQITSSAVNYNSYGNEFAISISVSQKEGDVERSASSQTKIIVNEYVLNFNPELDINSDIVAGMGEGIINVQVGTQTTFAIDLYEFIEYDELNNEVVNKIEEFFVGMSKQGKWTAYTNLLTDDQPNYEMADKDKIDNEIPGKGKKVEIGFNGDNMIKGKNYYFTFNGLDVQPTRVHLPEEKYYFFTYTGYFAIDRGVYVATSTRSSQKVETTFILNVYTSSSEESPIPIYDYNDLINMQKDGYYILLNDINIPSERNENGESMFKPINAQFASLDGNGHMINFAGTYNMGNLSSLGLFSTIPEHTVVKNLNINFTASNGDDVNKDAGDTTYGLYGLSIVRFITMADAFVFGAVAAENYGIITNCHVYTDNVNGRDYYLTIKADNALTGSSYIGGLVGTNAGYITNSGTSINVKAPFNIGGLTAQNFKKISGCYFKEGKLINNSQFNQHVAGFVVSNLKDAQIISSFVAGEQSSDSLISKDVESRIESSLASAGFVYENRGKIQDCYTDINLSYSKGEMAGFVYRNGGNIRNSFSLSILRNNVTASAGFVKENILEGEPGVFSNCYYFYNVYNDKAGSVDDGFDSTLDNINTSLDNVSFDGVEKLNAGQFAQVQKYFEEYSYQETMGTDAVWFFSEGNTSTTFVDYIPTTEKLDLPGSDGNTQTNTIYNSKIMNFAKNRLELINPNIKTLSVRNFSYSELDETTGVVTYYYVDDNNSPNRGTLHNPRLISSSETMESEILEQTSRTNINTSNYRLISDIDYETHSNLYKVIFAGQLEGNGMEISRISLVSMEKLVNAGMFAQIGASSSRRGNVKNLTISPREVSFNSTNSVGTLAGLLKYGEIYNIKVNPITASSSTVTGLNFVGGVVGRAVSYYVIKDIESRANASASYSSNESATYIENQGVLSNYSYAGAILGFAGNGRIYNARVNDVTSIMGSRAGFAFGGLGKDAVVNYTFINISPNSKIKAYCYGGLVVGENSGKISYSYVPNITGEQESLFSVVPKVAVSVGGVAGCLSGGLISNALVEQGFRATNAVGTSSIAYVGGIVGLVFGKSTISRIEMCKVVGDISATNVLGGCVGQVSSPLIMSEIAVTASNLMVIGETKDPVAGGIVGRLNSTGTASLELSYGYSTSLLIIKTSTSGIASTANVGGLIGTAGKTPTLSYCYTSSRIDAEVYDSRKVGSIQEYQDSPPGESNSKSKYSYNVTEKDNVYYLGGEKDSSYASTSTAGYVSFRTKTKDVNIALNVNNYGTPIEESTKMYNMFGNKFQLKKASDRVYDVVFKTSATGTIFEIGTKEYVEDENEKGKYVSPDGDWFMYDNLLANRIYKDSSGEYFIKEYNSGNISYKNLKTGTYTLNNSAFKEVWCIDAFSISTLTFENNFSWIYKA